MEFTSGHPRPSSVEALVYHGCPCRDPPVFHRVQDDSVAKRQQILCWLECVVVSVVVFVFPALLQLRKLTKLVIVICN